jgi:hypothetical protein
VENVGRGEVLLHVEYLKAIAKPIPREAPVINNVLPFKLIVVEHDIDNNKNQNQN